MSIYEVVAEPNRRQILDMLLERPHLVGEFAEELGISQPGVSKHLRTLRKAGLVQVRRDAQRRWYELRPEPLREIDQWLASYRQTWSERYDRLDDYLQTLTELENKDDRKESE